METSHGVELPPKRGNRNASTESEDRVHTCLFMPEWLLSHKVKTLIKYCMKIESFGGKNTKTLASMRNIP